MTYVRSRAAWPLTISIARASEKQQYNWREGCRLITILICDCGRIPVK